MAVKGINPKAKRRAELRIAQQKALRRQKAREARGEVNQGEGVKVLPKVKKKKKKKKAQPGNIPGAVFTFREQIERRKRQLRKFE